MLPPKDAEILADIENLLSSGTEPSRLMACVTPRSGWPIEASTGRRGRNESLTELHGPSGRCTPSSMAGAVDDP